MIKIIKTDWHSCKIYRKLISQLTVQTDGGKKRQTPVYHLRHRVALVVLITSYISIGRVALICLCFMAKIVYHDKAAMIDSRL